VHSLDVHAQSPQYPLDGPLDVPLRHADESWHHPQPDVAVQLSHEYVVAHGSLAVHWLAVQAQSAQLPLVGPLDVPPMQSEVLAHQPQPASAVHVSHEPYHEHSSAAAHSLLTQRQSEQEPVLGPVELPCAQAPPSAHQPQLSVVVQLSHGDSPRHRSPPVHSLLSQRQVEHEPTVGPLDDPPAQEDVSSHQPQPVATVHEPHVVCSPHGSTVPPPHWLASQSHSAHVPVDGPLELPDRQRPVVAHQPQG
jgi:hypothetical protein